MYQAALFRITYLVIELISEPCLLRQAIIPFANREAHETKQTHAQWSDHDCFLWWFWREVMRNRAPGQSACTNQGLQLVHTN